MFGPTAGALLSSLPSRCTNILLGIVRFILLSDGCGFPAIRTKGIFSSG
jgi:hypothetical protein